jgi:N-acetylglucosaminyl-diphospho-decaprenol L-rhamnosyltransferase
MSVDAIVVTYHTGPVLNDCLAALTADDNINRVILWDNGNPDETRATLHSWVQADPCRRVYIASEANLGFGVANNHASARSDAEFLLFINPDAMIERGAVAALLQALMQSEGPVLVGGLLTDADGQEKRGARRGRLTPCSLFGELSRLGRYLGPAWQFFQHHQPMPSGTIAMDTVSGALFLMRRRDFLTIGGFDARYFLHFEDVDLCRRVRQQGGEVLFCPGARAFHVGSTSRIAATFVSRHKRRSLSVYWSIWYHDPLSRALSWVLSRLS